MIYGIRNNYYVNSCLSTGLKLITFMHAYTQWVYMINIRLGMQLLNFAYLLELTTYTCIVKW